MENKEEFVKLIDTIDKLNCRLNWDEYFMGVAKLISSRSSCKKLNVGCVITKNNRIMCTGYNGHLPGAPHDSVERDGHEQMTVHAESNAINHAAKDGISIGNAKVYITHYPCINCTKSLISAGVGEIVYLNSYKPDPLVKIMFDVKGIKIHKMKIE